MLTRQKLPVFLRKKITVEILDLVISMGVLSFSLGGPGFNSVNQHWQPNEQVSLVCSSKADSKYGEWAYWKNDRKYRQILQLVMACSYLQYWS